MNNYAGFSLSSKEIAPGRENSYAIRLSVTFKEIAMKRNLAAWIRCLIIEIYQNHAIF